LEVTAGIIEKLMIGFRILRALEKLVDYLEDIGKDQR
jgi:hypothetical protein